MPRNDKLTPQEADLMPVEFLDGEIWTITDVNGEDWPPRTIDLTRRASDGKEETIVYRPV